MKTVAIVLVVLCVMCVMCLACTVWMAWSVNHKCHNFAIHNVSPKLQLSKQFRWELDNQLPSSVFPLLPAAPTCPDHNVQNVQIGVPHVVYRTWADQSFRHMPGLVQADQTTRSVLAKHSPDWQHLVFHNQACQAFVQTHFAAWPPIVWAYQALNYGVMKADFWRYLVIFQNGGLYLDMKSSITKLPKPPSNFDFDSCDKAVVAAWPYQKRIFKKHGEYVNWMVMAPPKNQFLWQVIWQVVRNVQACANSANSANNTNNTNDTNNTNNNTKFVSLAHWLGEPNPKASILCLTGPIMYTFVARTYHQHVDLQQNTFLNCFKYDLAGLHRRQVAKTSHYSKQAKELVVAHTPCPSW